MIILMMHAPKCPPAFVMADTPEEAFAIATTHCAPRAYSMSGIFAIAKDALTTTPNRAVSVTSRNGRYGITLAR